MAALSKRHQLYQELLDRYGREIADAFKASIDDLASNADLQGAIDAVEAGDLDRAIDALHIEPSAYNPLLDAVRSAYSTGGGQLGASGLTSVVARFDSRNYEAERWLRDHSAKLVTRIIEDQRQAVRQALVAGMERGENPRTTALEIVGRLDRARGSRSGGILGLTAPQERFVDSARQELAGADVAGLRNYLTRSARDKRFDRSVAKAIREGTALPADIQAKALAQYKSRLLKLRGDMIGRTEALTALNAGKDESVRQMISKGAVGAEQVTMVWKSAHDGRVRFTHRLLDGDTVPFGQPFTSPSGARMRFPGDTSLGAPGSETIGCRCVVWPRIKP